MPNCLNHPDKPAELHCATCGKAICGECVVLKKFCSESCAAAELMVRENNERKKEWKRSGSGSWIRPLAVLLILALLGYCAYRYYNRNKASMQNKVQKVTGKGKESIKEGRDYLGKESKYKKDRRQILE